MRKLATVLTGTAGLALAAPAFAQDAGAQDAGTFTGPRVEAIVGYDMAKAGSSIDDPLLDDQQSIDGVLYGVGVGYDFDVGGFVLGAEAELTDSTAKSDFGSTGFAGFGSGNLKANRDIYVGARAGARVGPNMLVYAKGGYTNAKFDVLSNNGTTELNEDIDADGWRVGAGAEYAFTPNMFAKLEYRYSNYQKAEIDLNGTLPDSARFDVDTDRHQIVAAFGFRF